MVWKIATVIGNRTSDGNIQCGKRKKEHIAAAVSQCCYRALVQEEIKDEEALKKKKNKKSSRAYAIKLCKFAMDGLILWGSFPELCSSHRHFFRILSSVYPRYSCTNMGGVGILSGDNCFLRHLSANHGYTGRYWNYRSVCIFILRYHIFL